MPRPVMVAGGEHCQLRAAIEVLVPYSSPFRSAFTPVVTRRSSHALFDGVVAVEPTPKRGGFDYRLICLPSPQHQAYESPVVSLVAVFECAWIFWAHDRVRDLRTRVLLSPTGQRAWGVAPLRGARVRERRQMSRWESRTWQVCPHLSLKAPCRSLVSVNTS